MGENGEIQTRLANLEFSREGFKKREKGSEIEKQQEDGQRVNEKQWQRDSMIIKGLVGVPGLWVCTISGLYRIVSYPQWIPACITSQPNHLFCRLLLFLPPLLCVSMRFSSFFNSITEWKSVFDVCKVIKSTDTDSLSDIHSWLGLCHGEKSSMRIRWVSLQIKYTMWNIVPSPLSFPVTD